MREMSHKYWLRPMYDNVKDEKIQDRLVNFWNGYGIEDFFNAPVVNRKWKIDRTNPQLVRFGLQ